MNKLIIIFLGCGFTMFSLAADYYVDDGYQDDYYKGKGYQDDYYVDDYYQRPSKKRKSKKLTPFNNWNNSMRRWSKGEGAWDNWRDWKDSKNRNEPWNMFGDAMGDMTADMMGDVVADIDFEIWLEVNFEADVWFDMDKKDKFDVYKYWQQKVEPHYNYSDEYYYDQYYEPNYEYQR